MLIGNVIGTVVATKKDETLVGYKLLIVQQITASGEPISRDMVAVDFFGAGVGEKVLLCAGSSAKSLFNDPKAPIDLAVVGIIDTLEIRD